MRKHVFAAVLTAATAAGTLPAQAAMIGALPNPPNDVLAVNSVVEGWFGTNLYLTGSATVKATLIGSETSAENTFVWDGGTFTVSGTAPAGSGTIAAPIGTTQTVVDMAPGLIDFLFTTDANQGATVQNGSNVSPGQNLALSFFVSLAPDINSIDQTVDGITPSAGSVAWIFLGVPTYVPPPMTHQGPAQYWRDYDDLVVRLEVTDGSFKVPEPGTLTLAAAALLGLGLTIRGRRHGC